MDQVERKSGSRKPLAGMVVILFLALFVGGWLYVDATKTALESKIDALQAQVDADRQKAAADDQEAVVEAAALAAREKAGVWDTYDGGGYTIDLPPGTKLSEGASVPELDYVIADPPDASQSSPFMMIRLLSASEKKDYKDAGGVLIDAKDGGAYWLALWENLEWKPFDQAVASFKVL